jgi:DHA2 family multidrug resistance protein-like MFS transporter
MNTAEDGLPLPQRYWAILTLAIGMVVSVLDSSIANIALPTIARQIGATPSQSIWVINAYQLAVVVSLLPLASLGDIFGYRRIYAIGFAIFTPRPSSARCPIRCRCWRSDARCRASARPE